MISPSPPTLAQPTIAPAQSPSAPSASACRLASPFAGVTCGNAARKSAAVTSVAATAVAAVAAAVAVAAVTAAAAAAAAIAAIAAAAAVAKRREAEALQMRNEVALPG